MKECMTYNLYKDICERTHGEIYIGVVGPVRAGKSTFVKRFMEVMVLPRMEEGPERVRSVDELPQSGDGRTITTTEPKFIPSKAVTIPLEGEIRASVRLIDCVGFMVEGAGGATEGDRERLVQTPWQEEAMPFSKAADLGTQKVIEEHSTIGIVVTTDGSIGTELERAGYETAMERSINALRKQNKPFLVVVNTVNPRGKEIKAYCQGIEEKYHVICLPINCKMMGEDEIAILFDAVLEAFPVEKIAFYLPKWTTFLPANHPAKKALLEGAKKIGDEVETMRDFKLFQWKQENPYIEELIPKQVDMSCGSICLQAKINDSCYYEMISDWFGKEIDDERDFLHEVKQISQNQKEISGYFDAINSATQVGYGIVKPGKEQIEIEKPMLIKQGSRYGVKILAKGPSMHLIRAYVETEIAPIVGDKEQAEELIAYIEKQGNEEGLWDTSIFGKTILQLVEDGMNAKMAKIESESQQKLQDSMQKIVNDSSGGMICIII